MGSNVTFQSRNVLSKKFMTKGARARRGWRQPARGGRFGGRGFAHALVE